MGLLHDRIRKRWSEPASTKAQRYINQFIDGRRNEERVSARVEGNHGVYTVTITLDNHDLRAACSCYIGSSGWCHHCEALAFTFLKDEKQFEWHEKKSLEEVQNLAAVKEYLSGQTLETLLNQMRSKGITQKDFAEAIGMSSRKLSAIKSSEMRNRYYGELGAVKLACLWVQERFGSEAENEAA